MQLLSDKHRQSKGALVWRARDNETAICNDRLFWLLVVTLIACESDHMSPALLHETSFSLVEILSFLLPILFFFLWKLFYVYVSSIQKLRITEAPCRNVTYQHQLNK